MRSIIKEFRDDRVYDEVKAAFTYGSNAIEGNVFTLEQVQSLVRAKSFMLRDQTQIITLNDFHETINGFEAFDYMNETLTHNLDHKLIKEFHTILRKNTSDQEKHYPIGSYKNYQNMVGTTITAAPHMVQSLLDDLLDVNKSIENPTDRFHYRFERIHPFQDGNGRVGRLILCRQSLLSYSCPCILGPKEQYYYYQGLDKYEEDPTLLRDVLDIGRFNGKRVMGINE